MFSSLNIKNFRIYWFGMFISLIGTWIQAIAQSWLVFELTHSALLLGVVGFLSYLPVFFLSLFGGVIADRMNRRNILILTQIAFMVLAFILAILTQLKLITPLEIIIISILNGIVMAFDAPCRQAVVVELVGKKYLFNAIALNSVAFNSSRLIGPALCAILVANIGMSGCFYVNGISFLALIIALLVIRINNPLKGSSNNTAWKDLKEGVNFIRSNRAVLILLSMVGMVSLFGVSYVILMPVFAHKILNLGIKGLGMLMSSSGLGALIAGLILARLGDFKFKGRWLILSSIVFSLSLWLFSLSRVYLLSLVSLIFIGGFSVTAISIINTLLLGLVSDEIRGRLMSVFMFTFAGLMPFGNLIAGVLSEALGVSLAIMISAIICTIYFSVINTLYPDIGNL